MTIFDEILSEAQRLDKETENDDLSNEFGTNLESPPAPPRVRSGGGNKNLQNTPNKGGGSSRELYAIPGTQVLKTNELGDIFDGAFNITQAVEKLITKELPSKIQQALEGNTSLLEDAVISAVRTIVTPAAELAMQTAVQIIQYVPPLYLELKLGAVGMKINNIQAQADHLKYYSQNFPQNAASAVRMIEDLAPDECWCELAAEVPIVKLGADFKVGMTKENLIKEIQRLG